jgi:hypothetical protein
MKTVPRVWTMLTIVLLLLTSCQVTTPEKLVQRRKAEPDFARTPPQMASAFIELLKEPTREANVRLLVKFEENQKLPTVIPLQLDERVIQLRDDGRFPDDEQDDGLFSAAIPFDIAAFQATTERLAKLREEGQPELVFEQRRLVDKREIKVPDFDRFRAGGLLQVFPLPFPIGLPLFIQPESSLLITDISVVEDPARTFDPCTGVGTPMGRWTFGHLMTQMANQPVTGIDPALFTRRWLRHWEVPQTVNFDVVPSRLQIRPEIIEPWELNSGGLGSPLDLAVAPFRLLAIVNRVDLRENVTYGGGSAGEARFVFGALRPNCDPLPFTVIFEYGIQKNSCVAVKDWGQQWVDLQSHPLGSPAYNAALEAITDQFVAAGANPAKLPNQSALNQLRTNEIALAGPWELREFILSPVGFDAGQMRQDTVKQTPAFLHNTQPVIADYVNANAAAILANKHTVPIEFPPGTPFLGGAAPTPGGVFWDGPPVPPGPDIVPADARHMFSLNTCSGCHAGETATRFTHIDPRPAGSPSSLSGFLTGISVADPADGAPVRDFDDLARRATDLDALVNSSCFFQIFFEPLRMVH